MKIQKDKLNVAVAVLTGLLVGFVFGAAYGTPGASMETTGKSMGNVSRISRYHKQESDVKNDTEKMEPEKDTVTFSAVDANGESWTIVMTSNNK